MRAHEGRPNRAVTPAPLLSYHIVLTDACNREGGPVTETAPVSAQPRSYTATHSRPSGVPTLDTLDALDALESESIHIFREVAGEFDRPVILFSGGKDSTLLVHLAVEGVRAGRGAVPAAARGHRAQLSRGDRLPGPAGRAPRAAARGGTRPGLDRRRPARRAGRRHPQPAADHAAAGHDQRAPVRRGASAAGAGTRSGPGPRSGSSRLRDAFGRWDPRTQRPELWNLYNGRHAPGEHVRVFPISNWTELDVWRYIRRREASSCRRSTSRIGARCSAETGCGWPRGRGAGRAAPETLEPMTVRYRTVGDGSCTGAVESSAVDGRRDHRGGDGVPAHRARRHEGRRPTQRGGHGRPEARGLLLMTSRFFFCCASPRPAVWTTGSPHWWVGCSTTRNRCLPTRSRRCTAPRSTRDCPHRTCRCWWTGCAPSASRASAIDVAYRYFSTPQPRVRAGRHPGSRAVHPQHGDGRVPRGAGRPARRRPARRRGTDQPARGRPRAAAGASAGAGHQQDRSDRLRRGCARRPSARTSPTSPGRWVSPTTRWSPSRCPRWSATTWWSAPSAPPGTKGRHCSGTWRPCR